MNEKYNKIKWFEEEGFKSKVYYHYTSLNALYEIIRNKTFWLTSMISSNDKKELYYKSEDFINEFRVIVKNEIDENTKKIFELLEYSLNNNIDEFKKETPRPKESFALSLSKRKDNLTHWDRYAEKASGVCIGVNTSALDVLNSRNGNIIGKTIIDIGSIIYDDVGSYLRYHIIRMCNLFIKEEKELDEIKELINSMEKYGYKWLAAVYQSSVQFIKDKAFLDEDEVRFYYDASYIKSTLELIDSMKEDIEFDLYKNVRENFIRVVNSFGIEENKFSISQAGIRSYRTLCLKEVWGSGTIPEIILGPMCRQNKKELTKFLQQNGLVGTKVSISEVPIR